MFTVLKMHRIALSRGDWVRLTFAVIIVGIASFAFLTRSTNASSAPLSYQASQGLVSSPASIITDATALNGQAVQFNAPTPDSAGFTHPGVLLDEAQLNYVKSQIAIGAQPWTNALANLNTTYANPSYTASPVATVDCTANPTGCSKVVNDAIAAYTQALLYSYSSAPDRAKYADSAINIMNAWSSTLTGSNGNQSRLDLAWSAEVFPRAAEIIRYTFTPGVGDPTFNVGAFNNMLNNVYEPALIAGDPISNGNWELAMSDALMNIGVSTDNRSVFNAAVSMWQNRVPAYIYLNTDNGGNGQPIAPPGGQYNTPASLTCFWLGSGTPNGKCTVPTGFALANGQTQETCRDISHPILGLSSMTDAAETARLQGVDLYSQQQQRMTAAYEYAAQFDNQYLNTGQWPANPCGGQPGAYSGQGGDGTGGIGYSYGWEIAYNEFANRLGIAMPNTAQMISRERPTGGVNNTVWETLTSAGPTLPAGCTLPDDRLGTDIITVTVPTTGSYTLWSRIKSVDGLNTSYTLQTDNNCPVQVGGGSLTAGQWSWVNYQGGNLASSLNLNLTAGTHTFVLTGNSAALSVDTLLLATDPTCVPVDNGANCLPPGTPPPTDTTPPTTSLTAPLAGATLTGITTLTANAADDTAVARVDFLANGVVVGSSNVAPYSFNWDTSTVPSGSYSLVSAAYDEAGNSTLSAPVVVTLQNVDTTPPTVVTNLTASVAGSTSASLNWTAATDNWAVSKYVIYRNGVQVATSPVLFYKDNSLSNVSTYTYTVAAEDAAGNIGPQSNAVTLTTPDGTAPAKPSGLTATLTASNTVSLKWSATTDNVGVASYTIARNGSGIATVSSTTLAYTDTTTVPATNNSYTILAQDAAGNISPASNAVSITTRDTIAPTAPTNLIATQSGPTTASLNWTAATDNVGVSKYLILRGGVQIGTSTTTSYSDSGLSATTVYTYTVEAQDSAGNTSAASASSSITTPAPSDTTPPSAPTSLKATVSGTSVALSWTAATDNVGVTGYKIDRTAVQIGTSTITSYNDSGLAHGTTYTYTVYAVDAAGNVSAVSNSASATIAAVLPGAPTAVTATAGDTTASVTFSAPSSNGGAAITSYTVTASNGIKAMGSTSPIAVSGLTDGTAYTFTVVATNSVGNSVASTASNSVTPVHSATVPGAPTAVTALAGNASAAVRFTAPTSNGGAPITSYTVTSTPGGIAATGTSSPITITGLTNGTSYTFTVKASNSVGSSVASAASTAVIPAVQLLPDPGFEVGNGGWIAFSVGTLTRVTTPVHSGSFALKVAAPTTASTLVGLTQNSVVSNSVAGKVYTAACYVEPTSANLNVQIRFLEYTQNYGSLIHLQTTLVSSLPLNTWTLVQVSSTAVNSGERIIPQIYSSNETSATGSLIYDDCSVTSN